MRIVPAAALSLAILCIAAPTDSFALSSNESIELAGQGRYEELRQGMEALATKGPLRTRDLHALCFAYAKTKRYNKIFTCLEQLAANIGKGDTRTRLFGLDDATPALYLMRAEAHLDLGSFHEAVQDATRTVEWIKAEGSDDTDMEIHALSLLSIASTLSGHREDGVRYAQQLEQVSTFTILGINYVSAKAIALARAYMALGEYAKVLDAIERDKRFTFHAFLDRLVSGGMLTGKSNWAWQELPRAFMISRALRGTGQTAAARDGYDRLLAIPQARDNGEIYWLTLYERGQIAAEENQLDAAIDFYKRAIEVIEQQRSSISTEGSKIGFVGNKQQVYERLIDALYARGQQNLAFEYIERSKSRALVDMLASRSVVAFTARNAGPAREALAEFDDAQHELLAQAPTSATEGKSVVRSASERALGRVREAAPELSALISVSAIEASRLQGLVPPDEAMVQYYYQGQSLYASVYSGGTIRMTKLNVPELDTAVQSFRTAIDKEDPRALDMARQLYDQLIRPLEALLAGKSRWLLIPHGALHYLPFSALHDGSDYLLARTSLRTLPSASVLPYLRAAPAAGAPRMLVIGNPDLGDPRHDLPSAQAEAESLAQGAPQSTLLLRAHASETTVKQTAAQYTRVHIASHGVFDQKRPLDSALMLARDANNDGKLTVAELYSVRLDADLVTLSACETGLGLVNSGDDVVGLTRGFLYAGARSVVASLWQVDDEATANLMKRFYQELGTGSKADALRAAQLAVRQQYPHPYYWSAFYLTGSAQ